MSISVFGASHLGKIRKNNEDAYFHMNLPNHTELVYAGVCDGVGGANYGEVASQMACDILTKLAKDNMLEHAASLDLRLPMLEMSARRAHQDIAQASIDNSQYKGMACTLIATLVDATNIGFINIGDSRLYHLSGKHFKQLSADQTVAEALVKAGKISSQDALTHPDRHTLQYCLGLEQVGNPLSPQLDLYSWQANDKLLLCSDGLSNMVSDADICAILQAHQAQDCIDQLIQAALDGGGKDNITALVLQNNNKTTQQEAV